MTFHNGPALGSIDRDATLLASSPKSGSREVVYLVGKENIGQSPRTLHSPSPETCHGHVMRKIRIVKGSRLIKLAIFECVGSEKRMLH